MPVAIIIGIFVSSMYVPAAEQLFFQEVPYRIAQIQQWEDETIFSPEAFETVRSVAAGERPIQEVIPSVPSLPSRPTFRVPEVTDQTAVLVPVAPAQEASLALASFAVPPHRPARVQYEVPSHPAPMYEIGEVATKDPVEAFLSDMVNDVVTATKRLIWNIVPFSLAVCIILLSSMMYYRSILNRVAEQRLRRWTDHPLPVSLGGGKQAPVEEIPVGTAQPRNRWGTIMDHALSGNPNDWRLAILDADIMLDEMLSVQGYQGDTVADKLRQVSPADFTTLELAWEAHKVRNKIAHEGTSGSLDEHEVRRVIGLYQRVFQEFDLL